MAFRLPQIPNVPKRFLIPFLVFMMLFTGVCNTLLTKYQDGICVRDCDAPNPKDRKTFEQPVVQTVQMFIGEMGCWIFIGYKYYADKTNKSAEGNGYQAVDTNEHGGRDNDSDSIRSTTPINPATKASLPKKKKVMKGWAYTLLGLPAVCDICGTTLMNVGLLFVVASIYQMTRGALVLFVGLLSVIALHKRLYHFQWFALLSIVLGVGLVGLAGAIYKDDKAAPAAMMLIKDTASLISREARTPEALRTILGIFLIAIAQIFTASQMVIEEWIIGRYNVKAINMVGWEGLFGFLVTVFGFVTMHLVVGRTDAGKYGYFDIVEGWREITSYRPIGISSIFIMISIGGFNFFGISVTDQISATARSTIDTCRTLFIWIISLFLGWETFKWLQVLGFALLVYGTFLFNGLVRPPLQRWVVSDVEELLPEGPIEHQ